MAFISEPLSNKWHTQIYCLLPQLFSWLPCIYIPNCIQHINTVSCKRTLRWMRKDVFQFQQICKSTPAHCKLKTAKGVWGKRTRSNLLRKSKKEREETKQVITQHKRHQTLLWLHLHSYIDCTLSSAKLTVWSSPLQQL